MQTTRARTGEVAGQAHSGRAAPSSGSSRAERLARGKHMRQACPRSSHAGWTSPPGRPDPVRLVLEADKGRYPDLLPLRHGRMVQSPFAFYRGSALAMAVDLAATPATGIRVQCGGDSHLVNFRGLAAPERKVIFAINDLDETLPAPWEWDVKRLAASVVIACRDNGLGDSVGEDAVRGCVRSYREHMAGFAAMKAVDMLSTALAIGCTGPPQLLEVVPPELERDPVRGTTARSGRAITALVRLKTGSSTRQRAKVGVEGQHRRAGR